MSKPYFECHVTVDKPQDPTLVLWFEAVARVEGWKTSFIDGDPALGKKIFFYFTCHSTDFDQIMTKMLGLVDILHTTKPDSVLRQKIERIVYDTKTGLGVDGVKHE